MTIDEAIETLEESIRQNTVIQNAPNTFFKSSEIVEGMRNAGRRAAALSLAVAALRARQTPAKLDRSRWEGCEYCKDMPKSILKGFCFACDRPLTVEAWAELERRINGGTTDS